MPAVVTFETVLASELPNEIGVRFVRLKMLYMLVWKRTVTL